MRSQLKNSAILDASDFIPINRASEITKYSKDYIGQLCRAGKLIAKRNGRQWLVQKESLLKHKAAADKFYNIPVVVEIPVSDKPKTLEVIVKPSNVAIITETPKFVDQQVRQVTHSDHKKNFTDNPVNSSHKTATKKDLNILAASPSSPPPIVWKFTYLSGYKPVEQSLPEESDEQLVAPIVSPYLPPKIIRDTTDANDEVSVFKHPRSSSENKSSKFGTHSARVGRIVSPYHNNSEVRFSSRPYVAALLVILLLGFGATKFIYTDDNPSKNFLAESSSASVMDSIRSLGRDVICYFITCNDSTVSIFPTPTDQIPNSFLTDMTGSSQTDSTKNPPTLTDNNSSQQSLTQNFITQKGITLAEVDDRIQIAINTALGTQIYAAQNILLAPVYEQIQKQAAAIGDSISKISRSSGTVQDIDITNISGATISGSTINSSSFDGTTGDFSGAVSAGSLETGGQLAVSGTGSSTISGDVAFDSDTLYVNSMNNRVGIGTSSPVETLAVNGPIYLANVTPSATNNRLYVTGGDLYYAGNLIGGASTGNWTSSGGDVYRTTGNVGIGTSSPYAKLSVEGSSVLGSSALAGYFTATTSRASTFPYASTTAISVSGVASTSALVVSGASSFNGNLTWATDNTYDIGSGANRPRLIIAANSLISGNSVYPSGLTNSFIQSPANGSIALYNNTGTDFNSLQFGGTTALFPALGRSSNALIVQNADGSLGAKLGIGTSTPYLPLGVAGGVAASYFNADDSGQTSTFAGGMNVNGVSYFAGNVGIGTDDPQSIFQVQKPGDVTRSIKFTMDDPTITFLNGSEPTGRIGNTYGSFQFGRDDNSYFGISSVGKVGSIGGDYMGVGFPVYRNVLDDGSGAASFSGLVTVGSKLGIGTSSPWALSSIAALSSNTFPLFTVSTTTSSNATSTAFIIDSNGNVGIGTSTPYTQLSVAGVVASDYFQANSATATSTFSGGFSVAGAAGLTVLQNGNVGVNTTSPIAHFEVFDSANDLVASFGHSTIGNSPSIYINKEIGGVISLNGAYGKDSDGIAWWLNRNGYLGGTTRYRTLNFGDGKGNAVMTIASGLASFAATSTHTYISNGLGSVGAPSYTFTGDLNTGLWSSGADTLNLSTGGSERIRVSSTGNIGIGTTSPYAALSVVGEVVAPFYTATSTTATSTFGGGLNVAGSSGLTVLQNGKVGIGTVAPSTILNVSGSTGIRIDRNDAFGSPALLTLNNSQGISGSNAGLIQFINGGSLIAGIESLSGLNTGRGILRFLTADNGANTERMRIDNTGKVGIATSTPNNLLDIFSTTKAALSFTGGITAGQWTMGYDVSNGRFSIASSTALGTTDRLVIDGNGDVGIGTTSPYSILSISNSVTTAANTPLFTIASTTAGTATSTLMTVLANGNVGIGTTSPSQQLSVAGNAMFGSGLTSLVNYNAGTFNYFQRATSTIMSSTTFAWSIATSTTATPILTFDTTTGGEGVFATTTINGGLVVDGGNLQYDYATGITNIGSLQTGNMNFDTDAGLVSWTDLLLSTASNNTPQGYTAFLNGSSTISVYGISNGSGYLQSDYPRVSIGSTGAGTSTPTSKLTVFGNGIGSAGIFELVNNASTTLVKVLDNGKFGIGTTSPNYNFSVQNNFGNASRILFAIASSTSSNGTTADTLFSVSNTGVFIASTTDSANATSTINGNLYVNGTSRSTLSYVGDLIFANNFAFTEAPLGTSTQGLLLRNQYGKDVLTADEKGNLSVVGDICYQGKQCFGKSFGDLSNYVSILASSTADSLFSAQSTTLSLSQLTAALGTVNLTLTDLGSKTDLLASSTFINAVANSAAASLFASSTILDSVASSTANILVGTGSSTSFLTRTFNAFIDFLTSAMIKVRGIFVSDLHVENKLCVDDVCVDKSQLKALLVNAGGTTNATTSPQVASSTETNVAPVINNSASVTSFSDTVQSTPTDSPIVIPALATTSSSTMIAPVATSSTEIMPPPTEATSSSSTIPNVTVTLPVSSIETQPVSTSIPDPAQPSEPAPVNLSDPAPLLENNPQPAPITTVAPPAPIEVTQ